MLTPDYLQALPDALVALWQQVEDDILRDVARRVGKMDGLTDTAAWQLWRLQQTRALRMDVVKLLAKYSGKSEAEIRRLLQQAGTDTLAADDAAYRAMGLQPVPVIESAVLLNLLNAGYRQTVGSWKNLTATTANTVTKQFEDALDRAWLQVSSGAFDYKTSIRQAVNELAREMKYIEYPSGHRDTLEVAVRRAVLTGVNQTGLKLQAARMDEMAQQGFENFVEVTAHTGARTDGSGGPADHAAWQGKVYHRGGRILHEGEWYEDFEAATGYGTGEGLGGWNCRHGFHPFWPGISKRNYTDEQLAAMNEANVPYNGKLYTRYEINQMQRALERKVRSAKRKYLAESEAGVDASRSAVQLKAARQQLQQFIRDTGGKADSSRTGVAGFGRSAASKATWAARKAFPVSVRGSGGTHGKSGRIIRKKIGTIDPTDLAMREKLVKTFCEQYASSPVENMMVITSDGEVHFCTDNNPKGVDCSYLGDKLKGSYNIHTHPPDSTQYSFSDDIDMPNVFSDGSAIMEAVDYKYRYCFTTPKNITFEQWDAVRYEVAKNLNSIMAERGIDFDDYEENAQHVLIDETCRRLGFSCYTRSEL